MRPLVSEMTLASSSHILETCTSGRHTHARSCQQPENGKPLTPCTVACCTPEGLGLSDTATHRLPPLLPRLPPPVLRPASWLLLDLHCQIPAAPHCHLLVLVAQSPWQTASCKQWAAKCRKDLGQLGINDSTLATICQQHVL
jgi:hypothetical protein